jgi:site-specific DNA recombinase
MGIYVRLSEVRPGEEPISLETQEGDCSALARRKGWKVTKVYTDAGRSAWSDKRDRPAFDRMLSDLEHGDLDGVVAWKQDRLGRRVAEVAALLDRCRQLDAIVATVTDGLDTTTPSGRMAAQVVAAAAELESANTSARVQRAMQARAERGEPHGGPRPFGYRRVGKQLVVDEVEAAVIRECVARLSAGATVADVLRYLRETDIRTSTGKRWGRRSLVNSLTSARIAGLREHDGREVEATWQPIISHGERDEIRALLAPARTPQPRARSYYLSGGLAVCGKCGASLKGRSWTAPDGRARRRSQYACSGHTEHNSCGGIAISAEALDDFIASVVISRLSSDRLRRKLKAAKDDAPMDDLYRRLRKLDAAADDLASAFGAGELDRHAYKVAADRNAAERRTVESQLRSRTGERSSVLTGTPSTEEALIAWWASATVQQRHALTAAVIDEIRVGPAIRGKRFDPDRLVIAMRDR